MNRHYPWFALLGVLLIALSLAMPASGSRVDPNAPAVEKSAANKDAAPDEAAPAPEAKTVADLPREIPETPEGGWDVYVVPIKDAITPPQLYILRRALKEAIANDVEVILLDMDTPGGRLDVTLEMMEALKYFEGTTMTFVDDEAISAGSYISIATEDIWFAPGGVMGAAAVITGQGQDLNETLKSKIDSYLRARVRAFSKEYRYRADVQRAMMDIDYRLEIDGKVIKEEGELLTVTADEAVELFGAPPQPLLAQGIATDIDDLLTQKFGDGNYNVRTFEVTWSEEFAKWFTTISPFLISAGVLLLIMEIKTPGFGVFGVGGITLLLLVFASQYFAGMAGNEPMLLFLIGIVLLGVEIFFVPGTLVAGMIGGACVLSSLIWALADIWPEGAKDYQLDAAVFYEPIGQVILGLGIAFLGALAMIKYLPESPLKRAIVLGTEVSGRSVDHGGGRSIDGVASNVPQPGDRGVATTDLHPGGQVEINGKRYQASVLIGSIETGDEVEVVEARDFSLVVRAV
ncbi:NfeD family protein [Cerasicoccus maritimus]|uniref:NfeD family protein n=1 Tax=Cerasicoccus maritimus TaxID=490089 RepID=UPI0028526971|nr:hypothetical protein [Cerasicoccus maritimus]